MEAWQLVGRGTLVSVLCKVGYLLHRNAATNTVFKELFLTFNHSKAMASAMETETYYCHSCDERIFPITEEKICPLCMGGFVEEMLEDGSDSNEEEMNHDHGNTDAPHTSRQLPMGHDTMFSIFNNLFTQMANIPQGPIQFSSQQPPVAHNAVPFNGPIAETSSAAEDTNQPATTSARTLNLRRSSAQTGQARTFFHELFHNLGVDQQGHFPVFGSLPPWNFMELHGNTGDYAWGPSGLDDIVSELLGQLDSTGPPPASEQTIKGLPKIVVDQALVDSGKDCSVCMETFNVGDEVKKLPCAHFFHIPCIEPWLKLHNTCPICRKLVEDPSCGQASSSSAPTASAAASRAPSSAGASTSVGQPFNLFMMSSSRGAQGHGDDHTYAE